MKINNQFVTPGTELTIVDYKGRKRRYRFVRANQSKAGQPIVDVTGPIGPRELSHSFYANDVVTVHRVRKGRP